MQEMPVGSLGQEDRPEKEMATHFSILAWRIPGTGEPGGLSSMGTHRVGHTEQRSSSSSILQVRLSQFPKATETGFELRQPKSRVCGPTHLASIGVDLSFPEVPFSSFLSSAPTLLQEPPGFLTGLFFNLQTDMINLMTLYQQS